MVAQEFWELMKFTDLKRAIVPYLCVRRIAYFIYFLWKRCCLPCRGKDFPHIPSLQDLNCLGQGKSCQVRKIVPPKQSSTQLQKYVGKYREIKKQKHCLLKKYLLQKKGNKSNGQLPLRFLFLLIVFVLCLFIYELLIFV